MSSKVFMVIVWLAVIALLAIGLIMVASTATWAGESLDPYTQLNRQALFAGIGIVIACFIACVDYRLWRKYIWYFYGIACFLLVLCYVPGIGKEINGAKRWISLGLQFQPSECAKIITMMALAHVLANNKDRIKRVWNGILWPGMVAALPLGLICFEKDLGTTIALGVSALCVFFVAGTRISYLVICLALVIGGAYWFINEDSNRLNRFVAWKDLQAHSQGVGLQQYRATIALKRGGVTGVGLGNSMEKHGTLPYAHTDFIFAPLGEEWGFAGTFGVLFLYSILTYAGVGVALLCRDPYGRMLAIGTVAIIFCPAMLNIAVVTATVPNSGLPLPFISFGGTNLVFTLMAIGVLTSIQRWSPSTRSHYELQEKDLTALDLR